jgi:branched-chain amino acid transport system ATP-binding protein
MSSLVLAGLSRRFGGLFAVRNVSFEVPAGRVTGLIGPNGAGKSTLVNLVAGLLTGDDGSIQLDGTDVSRLPPHRVAAAGIARTFQNIRLLKEASVLENVVAGMHLHDRTTMLQGLTGSAKVRRQDAEFAHAARVLLARFGMGEYESRLAGQLSYGHQRRVEIMRALAARPRVLMLDEPVAGMNDVESEDLGRIFRSVADDGVAVLLIEHNMRFVASLCDRIHVLSSGELIASGPAQQALRDQRVIDAYLGS